MFLYKQYRRYNRWTKANRIVNLPKDEKPVFERVEYTSAEHVTKWKKRKEDKGLEAKREFKDKQAKSKAKDSAA